MTVIHGDFGDTDTKVLSTLWNKVDADVHSFKRDASWKNEEDSERYHLRDIISAEQDTILFCGHGSNNGLWDPSGIYLFEWRDIDYVNAKNVIGIWCHAREFAQSTGLRGFYSSMFISNMVEASCCGIRGVSNKIITESEVRFCSRVNELLRENVPLNQWLGILQGYPMTNAVEEFNYNGLFYQD